MRYQGFLEDYRESRVGSEPVRKGSGSKAARYFQQGSFEECSRVRALEVMLRDFILAITV